MVRAAEAPENQKLRSWENEKNIRMWELAPFEGEFFPIVLISPTT
jgi:hypothetical protein